jgi:hypothetical protein
LSSLRANNTCGEIGFCGGTVEWTSDQPPFIDKDNYQPKYIYDEPCSQGPGVKDYVFRIYAFNKRVQPELDKKGATKTMITPPYILSVMGDHVLGNASLHTYADLFDYSSLPEFNIPVRPPNFAYTMYRSFISLFSR